MANVNDPNGFTPAYHMAGGTIRPSEFPIQSGATGDIFSYLVAVNTKTLPER